MPKKNVKFEDALARLEVILRALENGEGDLEELLKLYEEGISLIRSCNTQLENAEQKIKMLQMQQDGSVAMVDFQTTED